MVIYMGLIAVTLLILLGFTVISILYCRKMGKTQKYGKYFIFAIAILNNIKVDIEA